MLGRVDEISAGIACRPSWGTPPRVGPCYYAARIDPECRKQSHVRQLEALGTVTLQPAA